MTKILSISIAFLILTLSPQAVFANTDIPLGPAPLETARAHSESPFLMGFTSQEQHSSSLLDYNARYYDADLARFPQADKVDVFEMSGNPQDLNAYAYVRNNPVNATDPTGNTPDNDELSGVFAGSAGFYSHHAPTGLSFTQTGPAVTLNNNYVDYDVENANTEGAPYGEMLDDGVNMIGSIALYPSRILSLWASLFGVQVLTEKNTATANDYIDFAMAPVGGPMGREFRKNIPGAQGLLHSVLREYVYQKMVEVKGRNIFQDFRTSISVNIYDNSVLPNARNLAYRAEAFLGDKFIGSMMVLKDKEDVLMTNFQGLAGTLTGYAKHNQEVYARMLQGFIETLSIKNVNNTVMIKNSNPDLVDLLKNSGFAYNRERQIWQQGRPPGNLPK